MKITVAGTVPSRQMPSDNFTGTVWQDPVVGMAAPARLNVSRITFEPGARTAWHTHPYGQTLFVLAGCGLAQSEGGPIRVIRPGDVITFSPGEKHWHGAAPTTGMSHLAMQEAENGVASTWLEKVSDAQYSAKVDDR